MDPFDYAHGGFVVGADKQSSRGVDVWGEDGAAIAADAARTGGGGNITLLVISGVIIVCSLLMW